MARVTALSGFPEWLPAERIVEQRVLDTLRRIFELHGYASLNTRAVEPLERLGSKGIVDKEVYAVNRLHAEEGAEADLGLHFDLTVPTARYVTERAGQLAFPFKRYQIQPVWRGERPQQGRFREFLQADIDVIGDGTLPEHFETEVALVMARAFAELRDLGVPRITVLVNNRKLLEGFARGLGLDDVVPVLRAIDKLDKIGPQKVAGLLVADAGATEDQAAACLALAEISGSDPLEVERRVRALGVRHPLLDEGLDSLGRLLADTNRRAPGTVEANLKIARGLDYYTSTVYETVLEGHEDLGSVMSGGRYDTLATIGNRTFPGVGISFGVTRLLSRLFAAGVIGSSRSVPTAVLVAVTDEEHRADAERVADALRERGISADVAPAAAKFGKQIRFAERRGIPFVWFPDTGEVKDIRSGDQVSADPGAWEPAVGEAQPAVGPA